MSVMKRNSILQDKYPLCFAVFLLFVFVLTSTISAEDIDPDTRNVHDPTMIYTGEYAYVYSTGITGILEMRRSSDLLNWQHFGNVIPDIPAWVQSEISGVSNLWAPDITWHNGKYYLCYSASTFGSPTSLIALLSNETLNPSDPDYEWVDEGKIIDSPPVSGSLDYNAIDGTFVRDENGDMWLVFGSYWDGIMLTPLNNTTLKPTTSPPTIYHIAHRMASPAMEAAYITYRNGYYYLFVNFDTCCDGVNSTYKIMVGRSADITGPYVDKNGYSMMIGGGTLFVVSDGRWIGPGHAAITGIQGQEYFSFHSYDAEANGNPTLRIHELSWDQNAWPVLGDPVADSPPDPPTPPQGPVVAHWNFEDGTPGAVMNESGLNGQVGTADLSPNGFNLYAWDETLGPAFSAEGQTPGGFGLSARFDGGQDGYTTDASLNTWSPAEWTIELAVKLDTLFGWQTMIGRNGSSQGEAAADFYFQKNDEDDRFRVNFDTVGGRRYYLDADFTVQTDHWYYLAAVCDGGTLTLYADKLDTNGSQVVGTLTLETDNDNALAAGSLGFHWLIGRGWYDGYPADWIQGNLDHIRFTNRALNPTEFLNAQCGAWGYLQGDLNFNCRVDMPDFAVIAADWDGTLSVLEQVALQWLETTRPFADGAVHGTIGGPDPQ